MVTVVCLCQVDRTAAWSHRYIGTTATITQQGFDAENIAGGYEVYVTHSATVTPVAAVPNSRRPSSSRRM